LAVGKPAGTVNECRVKSACAGRAASA
jgi:hypothetical protein